jgi:hypothetical protein
MQTGGEQYTIHPLERFAALLAAILCAALFFVLWGSLSSYQQVWPFPGLYLLEMAVLAALGAYVFVSSQARLTVVSWGAAGAILAFCILGAWTVGLLYLPSALLLWTVSLFSDLRNRQPAAIHFGIFLLAGLAQAGLIVAILRSGLLTSL